MEVRIVSCQPSQRLERVVANPHVMEVLFDQCTDSGEVRVVELLIEHRSTVTGVAARAALGSGGKEEFGSTPLVGSEGAIVAGQESVPGRVPGDRRSQKCR